jgi:hypothetical protein
MRTATSVAALAIASGVVVVLAGCSAARPFPDGPTEADIAAITVQERSDSWAALFPGQSEPPTTVVRYVSADEQLGWIGKCLESADINRFSFDGGNLTFAPETPEDTLDYNRAVWICYQRYPLAPESVAAVYFNDDQLAYLYDAIVIRAIPCLRLAGYDLSPTPSRADFLASYRSGPIWNPYTEISPALADEQAWTDVVKRCPPPPFARTLAVGY